MVLLLLPGAAAVLQSCCSQLQFQSRYPFTSQSQREVSFLGGLGQWEGTGCRTSSSGSSSSSRVSCSEGFVNGTEVPVGTLSVDNDNGGDRNSLVAEEQCSSSPGAEKDNPWLELTKAKPGTEVRKSTNTLSSAFKKFLFVTGDSKQPKWADRRTAVLVVQNASNLDSALTRVGDKLEVSDLNLLLRRFGNHGRWDDACELFEWMEKAGKCSGASYSTFIILLGKVGRTQKALYVYNSLSEELKLNPFIANSILSTLVNNWKVTRAFRLFRKMKESGFHPDSITYSTIFCACLKIHNGYERSQELLEEMKARGLKPDAYAYGSLLRVYCATEMEDKAKALVEEMRSEGVTLTLYHYSYLINLYARKRKPAEAEKIFAAIKESGLEPNEIVYRSLLNVYGRSGLLEKARKTIAEIQASGMHPDMIMYSCVMDAYVSLGKVYEAHEILVDMSRKGVRPGGNAYSILIWGYGSIGDLDMVDKLAAESQTRRKGKQDVRLFNSLLKAYSKLQHDDGITNTLEKMDDEGIMPNKGSFNILIEHLCERRMFGLALRTYRDMKNRGLRPNAGTYSRLLSGLTNAAHLEQDRPQSHLSEILSAAEHRHEKGVDLLSEAYRIFKEMQTSEVYCHEPALEQFIEANAVAKNWPVAVEALGEMRKARLKPSKVLLEFLLSKAAEDKHYGAMSELLRHVKSQGCALNPELLEMVKQKFVELDQVKGVLDNL
ncbi:pentatricopeptide repeat-containing protein At1g10910, chloroplastic-like [Selaginella moellendorffii]|uniref:pentatricopeptide repeat-containing protein At1g10910, chloroplastic-like n=1 Tax=Selaginella moellendorffii TaxID=88036 RepID=UPI000D1C4DB2|nr:pentatricopeptide repeat-containing protein At1g10910, chloroplastic-like [Selaginella moellendorffii]|eukprot:XP_024516058.1 pentatricopeptide repeat-containing protein At1g10910, chloroplastic-like [Selaginella moellendorffii]